MDIHKSYYAIIPANVRYDKELSANAKLLYGEITALCNERGYCWASNSYFEELYGVSERTIERWIASLKKHGYIKTQFMYKEGTKEIKQRRIYITTLPTKMSPPPDKNVTTPPDKNVGDNNTDNNNTDIYIDIVEYLNLKAGTSYKHTTKKTKQLIRARLSEGFTIDDFKKVIDKKVSEWQDDERMSKYIRPETLFSNKFEGYLNQKTPIKEKKENKSPSPNYFKPFNFDV